MKELWCFLEMLLMATAIGLVRLVPAPWHLALLFCIGLRLGVVYAKYVRKSE